VTACRWDHREWCKVLVALAIVEPGDNWLDYDYRLVYEKL
jgi:hypothetical protein